LLLSQLHIANARSTTAPTDFPGSQAEALAAELRATITGEVRFDDGTRALYAVDGSNYRQVPIGIVIPKTIEDVIQTVALARKHGAPRDEALFGHSGPLY